MIKNKVLLSLLIVTLIFNVAFAAESSTEVEKDLSLNIEEAVQLGVENSIDLRIVENEIGLSALKQDRTDYLSKKLEDGNRKLNKAPSELSEKQKLLDAGKSQIDQKIETTTDPEELAYLKAQRAGLDKQQQQLDSIRAGLPDSKSALIDSLQEAGTGIAGNLNFDSLDALNVDSTSDLMTTMADISYEVTNASYDIYKNQIAMLIQNSYYNVLKSQKILGVKKKAMERAKKQYEFAKDSYDVGMKAKDDMLIADVYYKSTEIAHRKAAVDLQNALIELKNDLNVPLDTNIIFTDVLVDERETPDLKEGIESGLKNRLEMKKTIGEVAVNELNFKQIKKKYPDITYQYKEAELLKEKAELGYEKARQSVETSINQSYETLIAVGDMMEKAKDMVEKAKESVEIAEYKYKEGFGVENSLLKKLDLEAAAGTIVEVLAAEENLSNVEEQVVEIMYNYNLAKVKYYNDAGKFIY